MTKAEIAEQLFYLLGKMEDLEQSLDTPEANAIRFAWAVVAGHEKRDISKMIVLREDKFYE